jgi:hypothetical protein
MKFLSSKKGFFMSGRDWLSFFIGLVLFGVGLVPLLNNFKITPFGLPGFLAGPIAAIVFWIISIAGLYIIIDGLIEPAGHMIHTILLVLGAVFVVVGLIPILHGFKIIGFTVPFLDNLIVYNIIITVEGVMLMSAGFTMR